MMVINNIVESRKCELFTSKQYQIVYFLIVTIYILIFMMLRLLIAVALPLIYILKSNANGQNLSESSYLDRQLLFETSNEELITKKENLPIDRTNVILYAQEFKEGLNAFNQRNSPLAINSFEQIKEPSFLYVDAQKYLAVNYDIQTKYGNAYEIWNKLSKKHISKAIDGLAMEWSHDGDLLVERKLDPESPESNYKILQKFRRVYSDSDN